MYIDSQVLLFPNFKHIFSFSKKKLKTLNIYIFFLAFSYHIKSLSVYKHSLEINFEAPQRNIGRTFIYLFTNAFNGFHIMYMTLQRFFNLVKHFALKEKTKTNILFLIPSPFIILKFAVLLQENED